MRGSSFASIVLLASIAIAVPGGVFPALPDERKPAGKGADGKAGKKEKKAENPAVLEELPDGRVKMVFFFFDPDKVLQARFEPAVSRKPESNFRWSRQHEPSGLHLKENGTFHLNCWFKDDLEAEIEYLHGTNYSNRHLVAFLFTNSSKQSLGNVFGSQCATFSSGKLQKSAGAIEPIAQNTATRFKLVIGKGSFESHLKGEKQSDMRYQQKSFESGRLGFLWDGNLLASTVTCLEVTGRIDVPRMAKEMRKAGVKSGEGE